MNCRWSTRRSPTTTRRCARRPTRCCATGRRCMAAICWSCCPTVSARPPSSNTRPTGSRTGRARGPIPRRRSTAARELIAWWRARGRDPRDKLIVLSDGMDIDSIEESVRGLRGRINVSIGWGTNLTNDFKGCALGRRRRRTARDLARLQSGRGRGAPGGQALRQSQQGARAARGDRALSPRFRRSGHGGAAGAGLGRRVRNAPCNAMAFRGSFRPFPDRDAIARAPRVQRRRPCRRSPFRRPTRRSSRGATRSSPASRRSCRPTA